MDEVDLAGNYTIDRDIGFGSKYDMSHIRGQFCCSCFDYFMDRLRNLAKVPLEIKEYTFHKTDKEVQDAQEILKAQ